MNESGSLFYITRTGAIDSCATFFLTHNALHTPKRTGMSKRRAPGSGLKGAELFKAISTLEELDRLSQAEELEEDADVDAEASQVASEKIKDLLAILKAKAEGPTVSSASWCHPSNFLINDSPIHYPA